MDKSLVVSLRKNRAVFATTTLGTKTDQTGFSLAEVLVIIAVIAIVAGFTIPMLSSSVDNWQLTGNAREIATTLSTAKLSSTAQMNHYQLSFAPSQNRWRLNRLNKTTNAFDLQFEYQLSKGVDFKASSTSAPVGFPTSSSSTITFNSRGIPIDITSGNPTANNVIYLSNDVDNYAITVSLSGKVQIWKHVDGAWTAQ